MRFLDRHRQAQQLQVDGLLAVCIQHEMDHLDGKLFVDYLSPLKREMVRKKLAKQRKLAGRRGLTGSWPRPSGFATDPGVSFFHAPCRRRHPAC